MIDHGQNRFDAFPPRYKKPEYVWVSFVAWWQRRWPGRVLPATHGLHNLRELTGLSDAYLEVFLTRHTPARILPARILPPLRGVVKSP